MIQVDQSNKIERTNVDTVLALANDESYAVLIPADVKRACQEALRRRGKEGMAFVLRVFSAGLFLLLERYLQSSGRIVIDTEYIGHEATIKAMLLRWVRVRHPEFRADRITFAQVGKESRAHDKAIRISRGREQADCVLSAKRILDLL